MTKKYQDKIDNLTKKQKTNEFKTNAWNTLYSKIYSFYTESLSSMKFSKNYSKTISTSSSSALSIDGNVSESLQSVKILNTANTNSITSAKLEENINSNTKLSELGLSSGTYKFNDNDIKINDDDTMKTFISKLKDTGININFDENQHRIFISAKKSGSENNINLSENSTSNSLLGVLGIPSQTFFKNGKYYTDSSCQNLITDELILNDIKNGKAAIITPGEDAEILLNGAIYKNNENTFKINNVTYTINNYTDEEITVSSKKDNSQIYDNIKSFINKYNSIMNEMTKLYNTSNQGYKPLVDSEEEAMIEKEIEKWNKILENSSLYKDSRLNTISNNLRSIMIKGVEMNDGSTMYLSDFGINTGGYFTTDANERNAYHIDGDTDDTTVSNKQNKLLQLIENEPEKVEEFFTKLSKNLYDKITDEMKSTEYSSIYKVYNDKQLSSQNTNYQKEINRWQEKMSEMEDKYYKQFALMESALANMNSQMNALNQLFQ